MKRFIYLIKFPKIILRIYMMCYPSVVCVCLYFFQYHRGRHKGASLYGVSEVYCFEDQIKYHICVTFWSCASLLQLHQAYSLFKVKSRLSTFGNMTIEVFFFTSDLGAQVCQNPAQENSLIQVMLFVQSLKMAEHMEIWATNRQEPPRRSPSYKVPIWTFFQPVGVWLDQPASISWVTQQSQNLSHILQFLSYQHCADQHFTFTLRQVGSL